MRSTCNNKGWLVPQDNLLDMTENEKSFDKVKGICDVWTLRNNYRVKKGDPPILMGEKKRSCQ